MTTNTLSRLRPITILIGIAAFLLSAGAMAQPLDISGWQILQYSSTASFTVPDGTVIQPGYYLVLSRFASQSAFEAFYGVTLGSNVIYMTNEVSNPVVPMINGDEVYELRDPLNALIDGPTPAITSTLMAHHRDDPEASPWTSIDTTPTPGSGVEAPDATFSGLVITEVNDAVGGGNYIYEFVELYYDADAGSTNLPPVISGTEHTPPDPGEGDDLTISTTATDPDGTIVEVLCYWRYSDGSYVPVTMTGVGDDYSCVIPSLQADRLLQYYITAEDDEGALTSDPLSAPTTVYSVWIAGDLPSGHTIMFDHAHAQDAGTDGNWRVDDDYPNPLPAAPTSESDWSGQLSAWAYELYLAGNTITSNTTALTPAMLTGVDMLVIVEPQDQFTAAEISAVGDFVFNGGSLFVVANHNGSDRNNNGWDSASILGGYTVPHIQDPVGTDTETFCGALFGLHFHVKDEGNNGITGVFSNVTTDPTNQVINGPSGPVNAVIYHVGNVMSIWPTANPNLSDVEGFIWKDGDTGNPDVNIAAWSRYGDGKVLGYGDSSSCADGTGSEPHANNWNEAGGDNREFFMNGSWWLLTDDLSGIGDGPSRREADLHLSAWPNPFNPTTTIGYELSDPMAVDLAVYDVSGRLVTVLRDGAYESEGHHVVTWHGRDAAGESVASGVYFCRVSAGGLLETTRLVLVR